VQVRRQLCVRTVSLRSRVRLRACVRGDTLITMDARTLVATLAGERTRFVAMAQRRVGTAADAEDVVQRAMIRAAERADSLADPARARAWFYRILRNAIVDHHRAKRNDLADDPDAIDELPAEAIAEPLGCACAVHLLDELRPAYTQILRRVDIAGEDPAVVAADLAISTTNFHVRLHRARSALRDRVAGHCGVASIAPCLVCNCHAHGRCGST
jgi:RNA polymerase sigma factor (sigma-70 family)